MTCDVFYLMMIYIACCQLLERGFCILLVTDVRKLYHKHKIHV